MSVLIENKTASGAEGFVVSCFAFYCFINRLGFILFSAFFLLLDTQRIFSAWRLLLFLLLCTCLLWKKINNISDISKTYIYYTAFVIRAKSQNDAIKAKL